MSGTQKTLRTTVTGNYIDHQIQIIDHEKTNKQKKQSSVDSLQTYMKFE